MTVTITSLPPDWKPAVLNHVTVTPGVLAELEIRDVRALAIAYANGDFGEVDEHDQKVNEDALKCRGRVMGVYVVDGRKVWIITDPEWHTTTVLLPEEY